MPIPENFPGTVLLQESEEEEEKTSGHKYALHPNYRKESNDEFKYFVERMMTSIQPKRFNFKENRSKKLLSDIFTPSDEAYALCLLRNEYGSYVASRQAVEEDERNTDEENKNQPKKKRYTRKPFSDRKSGDRGGWNQQGLKLYGDLVKHIKKLRETPESKAIEQAMLQEYQDGLKNNRNQTVLEDKGKEARNFDPMSTVDTDDEYAFLMEEV